MIEDWAVVILKLAKDLVYMVKEHETSGSSHTVAIKSDTSPATDLEYAMESYAMSIVKSFYGLCGFWGEELGKHNVDQEYVLVIDPIDGTRTFLNGFHSYAITMTLLQQKEPLISLIGNPPTGDVYFRIGQGTSQLTNCLTTENHIPVQSLPLQEGPSPIVNIHSSLKARTLIQALYEMWEKQDVWLIRSNSGSPALMIMEATRTNTMYINLWSPAPSAPYDLIAAQHISEGSSIQLFSQSGEPMESSDHSGPFICCADIDLKEKVLAVMRGLS